ncbi:phosphate ABC transporter permease PstA [Verrucosispora sp. WMMA2044]|uniref:Phosphate transport system permease protein PstA n=1 Tax=Verrucosispora sioxanthis TaxID=2499994 RepID=A0A6M1LCP5_9ACTN|nr:MULTISPECIES: phosphate ABC transporter permease PstA [Micromonospora]NEE66794.1 phosphate ABC transporter permease PstA [Verrucosispora sioxanthis]NGM15904.1 phosphate ABC transporter permease PstA [Verrucosispora sioxanthis]WBB50632.1 phosphate ABC transporter permease PstA [Verrucosispora sp. WMMA2044]
MTLTAPPAARPAAGGPDLTRAALSGRRRFTNHLATAVIWFAVLLAVIPLALVTYTVIAKGGGVMSLSFLNEDIPNSYRREGGGMGPAIVGTLLITGMAALMAIPLGVFGAIYLNEYGKQRPLARIIRLMADVMTGVPSIVMGLFIYISWVLLVGEFTGFAGALALACLMLPVVIRSSEEMLRLVPDELRQASMALGARKWKTTLTVVLPAAISGITSGSLLAVARAAGETAPIIIVTGIVFSPNWNLFDGSNTALPAQIFRNASTSFPAAQDRAWGAALTLIVIVLGFTIIARFISSRFAIKER